MVVAAVTRLQKAKQHEKPCEILNKIVATIITIHKCYLS